MSEISCDCGLFFGERVKGVCPKGDGRCVDDPRPKSKPAPSAEPELWEQHEGGFYRDGFWLGTHQSGSIELQHGLDDNARLDLGTLRALLSRAGLAIVPAADVPTPEERHVLKYALAWLQSDNPIDLGKNEGMMVLALRRYEAAIAAKEKTDG